MTAEEIRSRVSKVRDLAADGRDDEAHAEEDKLLVEFVQHIAGSGGPMSALAEEVLKSRAVQFERWTA